MAPHIPSRSSPPLTVLLLGLLGVFGVSALAHATPTIARGPYLQIATSTGITIKWRTSESTESRVRYGATPDDLGESVTSLASTTEHELRIEGLSPATRYYYSIETATDTLAGDEELYFVTSPPAEPAGLTRLWILGDSGTRGSRARSVRDAYTEFAGGTRTDLILMLGDNAYPDGTDDEYQEAVFDMYPEFLKTTPLWPVRGNHDRMYDATAGFDYYDIFSLPSSSGAGGLASGTEAYYSFDYGNIHLVALDSEGSDRSPEGPMVSWLGSDLAATDQLWIIAFWHHPPYSHGSHNSSDLNESGGRLREMRENVLPVLEAGGVDLVLTGHSHSYERSFLVNGFYGSTESLDSTMIVDGGDGRVDGDGPYEKPASGRTPEEGAVFVVAGSSGKINSGDLDHPIMIASILELGSVALDIDGLRLDARFINSEGVVRDSFTLIKDSATAVLLARFNVGPVDDGIEVRWELGHAASFTGIVVERADVLDGPWSVIGAERLAAPGVQTAIDTAVEPGRTYYYRLRASQRSGEDLIFGPLGTTAGEPDAQFTLVSVAPNPTRGTTRIDYTVARESEVRLSIVDIQGRVIAELAGGFHRPGRYQAMWTGETERGSAPAGVYFVRGRAGSRSIVERLILAR